MKVNLFNFHVILNAKFFLRTHASCTETGVQNFNLSGKKNLKYRAVKSKIPFISCYVKRSVFIAINSVGSANCGNEWK